MRPFFGETPAYPSPETRRIAAASAGLYPPGVPLICPGERFDGNVLTRLMNAGNQQRFGVEGDKVLCVTTSV